MKPPKPPVPAPETKQAKPPATGAGLPPGPLTAGYRSRYSLDEQHVAFEWLTGHLTDMGAAIDLGCSPGAHVRSRVAAILRDALKNNIIRIEVL